MQTCGQYHVALLPNRCSSLSLFQPQVIQVLQKANISNLLLIGSVQAGPEETNQTSV